MEDLNKLLDLTEAYPMQLEQMTKEFLLKLRIILWGQVGIEKSEEVRDLLAPSTQQTIRHPKRLSSLIESNEIKEILATDKFENGNGRSCAKRFSPTKNKLSNAELLVRAKSTEDAGSANAAPVAVPITQFENSAASNEQNEATATSRNSEGQSLMTPPPAPVALKDETLNRRPQRAAKLKSEKNLKEPQLKTKLRRPTNEIKIKLQHELRPSQKHEATPASSIHSVLTDINQNVVVKSHLSSEFSDDLVSIIPEKKPSIVTVNFDFNEAPASIDPGNRYTANNLTKINPAVAKSSQDARKEKSETSSTSVEAEESADSIKGGIREICMKVNRAKLNSESQMNLTQKSSDDTVFKLPAPVPSNTTTTTAPKKVRKEKNAHRPIKVERFSELDSKPAPISSRSVYEVAVEGPPMSNTNVNVMETKAEGAVNETVNIGPTADATMKLGPTPYDATFCANPSQITFQVAPGQTTFVKEANPNATITLNKHSGFGPLADATFNIHQTSKRSKGISEDIVGQRSFETPKDTFMANDGSLLTEDEVKKPAQTISKPLNTINKTKAMAKVITSANAAYKMPTRTHELFNPLAQSQVKMRVEAIENAAAVLTEGSKRLLPGKRENVTPSQTATTPVIGKLPAPALRRFLTPTQNSNLSCVNSAITKKTTKSASKALPMTKSASASSLQRSNSTASSKTLQHESSDDDFRKGIHSLAEERKKLQEQKQLLAAQEREAKERKRAERKAKLAKEREENCKLKKQQEQKKRELEEIQRKLRQQKEDENEVAKLKAAKDREMLLQMKLQQQLDRKKKMLTLPPPKPASKYTFEMLHEDDSTDDEDKVSYKRPPPPTWSRRYVRGPFMLKQEYTPSACIDSFFSVQPMTPELKLIFPNIDARHLKRNSSVLWSTPPRYSELTRY